MKLITATITIITLLLGSSYTSDYYDAQFKSLEYNYNDNTSSQSYNNTIAYLDYNNDTHEYYGSSKNDSWYENEIIDFIIARCNDGVTDYSDFIEDVCYYNGGINFLIHK